MGKKSSSDEAAKAAKAGLCACGICCALCIGIPLLIIIIIIIIIVVAVGSAADETTSFADSLRGCDRNEVGDCGWDLDCKGDRTCNFVTKSCEGNANC